MEEWKEYQLGDVCSRLSSGKNISASKISDSDVYPVFGGNGLRGYTDNSNFTGDCAIIGRQGAFCGNVRFFSGEAYMTEHAVVVCGNEKANTRYLSYLLSTMNLGRLSGQSAQPGLAVGTLAKQLIKLPPLPTQQKIAAILSSLDDKIELNNKINTNLEQQAGALFKNWFVDFEPFGGEMPGGWKEVSLNDVCIKITDGSHYSPKDDEQAVIPMLSVKDMEKYDFNTKDCKHINEEEFNKMLKNDCVPQVNDILVAKDGSYLKEIFICNKFEKLAILSSIAIFRPNTKIIYPELLLTLLKSPRVMKEVKDNYVSGSALPRIVLKDFKKLKFFIPNISEQSKLAKILSEIRFQIDNNVKENQNLSELRDTLLPKLMNGEFEV